MMKYTDTFKAVFRYFKEALNQSHQLQFNDVIRGTARCAQELGFIECRLQDGSDFLNPEYANESQQVLQITWSFIVQGLIVPGNPRDPNASWPWLTITEYGKESFEKDMISPYDSDGYVEALKPDISANTEIYLLEALKCFKADCYIATMAMLGSAGESIILELFDAYGHSIKDRSKKDSYDKKVLKPRLIHQKWNEFYRHLSSHKSSLVSQDGSMNEAIEHYIPSIFNIIRSSRNESGHPTGKRFSREEVEGYFDLFPYYCKSTHGFIKFLKSKKRL